MVRRGLNSKSLDKGNIILAIGMWLVVCLFFVPTTLKVEFNFAPGTPKCAMIMEGYGTDGEMIFNYSMSGDYLGNRYIVLDFWEFLESRGYVIGVCNTLETEKINLEISDVQITIGNFPLLRITSDNWDKFLVVEWEAFFDCNDDHIMLKSEETTYATFGIYNLRSLLKSRVICFGVGYLLLCAMALYVFCAKRKGLVKVLKNFFCFCRNIVQHLYPYVVAGMIGLIVAGSVIRLLDTFALWLYMPKGEFIVWVISILMTACFVRHHCKSVGAWLIIVLCASVCLFFSIYKMTSYCTVDEPRAIAEQLYLQEDALRHWLMTESRTTYLFMGTFWTFAPYVTLCNWLDVSSIQLAQLVFWFTGFCVIQIIVYFLYNLIKKYINEDYTYVVLGGCYAAIFTIPLLNMALKNYTYDMLSMIFGILGVVQMVSFVVEHKKMHGVFSIISLVLSVQEKIICVPILIISIFIYAFVLSEGDKHVFRKYIIYGVMISCSVSVFTHWWVLDVLRLGNYPPMETSEITGAVFGGISMILSKTSISFLQGNIVISFILIIVLLSVGRNVICIFQKAYVRKAKNINSAISVAILGWICVGIVINFLELPNSLNFIFRWILEYPARIVNALPTIFIVGVLLELLWIKDPICLLVLLYCTYANTIIYMVDLNHLWIKYSNVYVGIICLCGFYGLMQAGYALWKNKAWKKQIYITSLLIIFFTLLETVESMPAYTYFAPYWNFSIYYKKPTNYGWGEYISVAGEKISRYCTQHNIDISESMLYRGYHGSWNDDLFAGQKSVETALGENANLIQDNDFILIDNYVLNVGEYVTEIDLKEINPVDKIEYRGVVMLRIYRGDQLRDILISKGAANIE